MDFQDDAAEFSAEDVDTIVKNAITGCLTDVMYNPKKVTNRLKLVPYFSEDDKCPLFGISLSASISKNAGEVTSHLVSLLITV